MNKKTMRLVLYTRNALHDWVKSWGNFWEKSVISPKLIADVGQLTKQQYAMPKIKNSQSFDFHSYLYKLCY